MSIQTRYDALAATTAVVRLFVEIWISHFTVSGNFINKPINGVYILAILFSLVEYFLILKGYQWVRIVYIAVFLIGAWKSSRGFIEFIRVDSHVLVDWVSFAIQWLLTIAAATFVALGIAEYGRQKRQIKINGLR